MYDVLISGGGPVGLGLAIELGQRGIAVAVVEQNTEPPRIPKGQNLTQRTMEHMQAWGIEDEIRAAKTIPKGYGLGGLTAYRTLLSGYHYDWFKRGVVDAFYNASNERLPQYATEEVLRRRVEDLNSVHVYYGYKTTNLSQDNGGVTVRASSDDGKMELRGSFLVGCDGSRSFVRGSAGLTETLDDHDRLMALVVFESPEFFKLLERFPDKQFYNVLHPDNDGYWMFFGMVEWGKSFFFHSPVPSDTDRRNFDFRAHIHKAVGVEFEMNLDYVGFWDLRISLADAYRNDRIFIAGDAAHSHPPYGGYGVNTGFEDARNLGWKLAAVLQGWGGPELLDSYEAERRPVFASTARDFINRFIEDDRAFVREYNPDFELAKFQAAWAERADGGNAAGVGAYAPHYEGSPVITSKSKGPPSAVGRHGYEVEAGHHLPPIELDDGRTAIDELGAGLTVLAPSPATPGLRLPIGLDWISLCRVPAPCATELPAFTVVRPDGYVAGTAENEAELYAVVSRAIGKRAATAN